MKFSIILAVGALALLGAARAAETPKTQTICLSSGGQQRPATCRSYGGGSRLASPDDICTCPGASQMVKAPICGPGETPAPEGAAYEQARLKAIRHGSLEGASWQGKPMCVADGHRAN